MRPHLKEGDNDEYEVRHLQQLLADLNYYEGQIDGDFGPLTRDAVERFQDHQSVTDPRGEVQDATWRSLEDQFGQIEGLRSQESTEQFVEDTYGVANSSMDPADRLAAMEQAANRQLTAAGVPYVSFEFEAQSGTTIAVFAFDEWTVKIGPTPFNNAFDSMDGVSALDTIYHESLHAEQWFNIARLMAGLDGLDAATVSERTGIPAHVCDAAVGDPIIESNSSTEKAIEFYESVYGSGSIVRNQILTSGTYEQYRNDLPEEHDSHIHGVRREYEQYETGEERDERGTLREGDNNPSEIWYLQELLTYHEISPGAIDGDFGAKTKAAVETFQASQGLTADGVVGPATWEALIP